MPDVLQLLPLYLIYTGLSLTILCMPVAPGKLFTVSLLYAKLSQYR